jgi:DNA sulfur modification protein DndD
MVHKLEEYKKHVEMKLQKEKAQKEIEEQTLFKNKHIEELHNLSISLSGSNESYVANIAQEIKDRLELVARLKGDLKTIEGKIQDIMDEKARLLIQAGNIPESVLEKDFNDIKGLYKQRERASVRLAELTSELEALENQMKELKSQMDLLDPKSSQVIVYRDVHRTLEEIAKAFGVAKKNNLRHFLADMQDKANSYLSILSANDFHGEIHLVQTADESTEIRLYSSNGTEIKKPSGSQETVMYISVLFAISDFTHEKRDEDYPLIFDAATSSFGDLKEEDFYNVINGIKKQCIIVTKDFMTKGVVRMGDVEKLNCPVYRIEKAAGFNQNDLATVRTIVEKIKS